jgi:hypothetical protein
MSALDNEIIFELLLFFGGLFFGMAVEQDIVSKIRSRKKLKHLYSYPLFPNSSSFQADIKGGDGNNGGVNPLPMSAKESSYFSGYLSRPVVTLFDRRENNN